MIIIPKHVFTEEMIKIYKEKISEGLCYKDIAKILGVTYGQVRNLGSRLKIYAKPQNDIFSGLSIGDKIGHLTIVKMYYDKNTKKNNTKCDCICDCGKYVTKQIYTIKNNPNVSCGCSYKQNLIGNKYGRWYVVKRVDNVNNRSAWLCRCECGNVRIVLQQSLLSGSSVSCGCYQMECISGKQQILHKKNNYDLTNEYGVGFASNTNKPFFFDKDNFDLISEYTWREDSNGYIVTNNYQTKKSIVCLHRLVMNAPDGMVVDHINHDVADNRKINLRICTVRENILNSDVPKNNKTGAKGLFMVGDKWLVKIKVCGEDITIGIFDTIEEAKVARLNAENEYYGEYSYQNSIKIAPPLIQYNG